MLHAIPAVFLVEVDDGFRVAARAIAVPLRLQPSSQFFMVINLAIENDPDILVLVGQRLMAALDVNDAQTPHGEADILLNEETLVVGPSMHDSSVHAGQDVTLDVPVAIGKEDAADPTHISESFHSELSGAGFDGCKTVEVASIAAISDENTSRSPAFKVTSAHSTGRTQPNSTTPSTRA